MLDDWAPCNREQMITGLVFRAWHSQRLVAASGIGCVSGRSTRASDSFDRPEATQEHALCRRQRSALAQTLTRCETARVLARVRPLGIFLAPGRAGRERVRARRARTRLVAKLLPKLPPSVAR